MAKATPRLQAKSLRFGPGLAKGSGSQGAALGWLTGPVPSACYRPAVMPGKGTSFQELADEAFADLLKKHKQPVNGRAATNPTPFSFLS